MKKNELISPITKDTLNLVEIYKFDVDELKKESYEKMLYIGEIIEEKAKDILKKYNLDIKTRNFYAYILREIMRNIPEHSDSETLELVCYKNSNELAFKIIDKGITIKESLNRNPRFDIVDDKSAVAFAIKPGVTRSYKRDPHRDDVWQNSGFGLYMVSSIMKKLGYFELKSGSGKIVVMKDKANEFMSNSKIIGTDVLIVFDKRIGINITETLKELSTKGSELAKNSNFSTYADIKTASQASTLIE